MHEKQTKFKLNHRKKSSFLRTVTSNKQFHKKKLNLFIIVKPLCMEVNHKTHSFKKEKNKTRKGNRSGRDSKDYQQREEKN